jgi:hypothetical protein
MSCYQSISKHDVFIKKHTYPPMLREIISNEKESLMVQAFYEMEDKSCQRIPLKD